jgi:Domain of unknown function (DUF1902)
MYRIGLPFWKTAARLGVPLLYRIDVTHDVEADVYIATSPDIQGLVAEMPSVNELLEVVHDCAYQLLEIALQSHPKARPWTAWNGNVVMA